MKLAVSAGAVFLALAGPSAASPDRQAAPQWRTATACTTPVKWARPQDLELRVSYTHERSRSDLPSFTWKLRLRNTTAKTVSLGFGTSQYADVIVSRDGAVVYDWERGKGFFQALGCMALGPHEVFTRTLGPEEIDTDSLEPGRYVLHAFLEAVSSGDWPLAGARASFWVFPAGDDTPLRH